jgi:hypothetical protein
MRAEAESPSTTSQCCTSSRELERTRATSAHATDGSLTCRQLRRPRFRSYTRRVNVSQPRGRISGSIVVICFLLGIVGLSALAVKAFTIGIVVLLGAAVVLAIALREGNE